MDRNLEEFVWRRAANRCEYCQLSHANQDLPFEIDHIIAEHHQGRTEANNLCLACFGCNRHKGPNIAGIDPQSGKIVPLFNPRTHKRARHFHWDGPILIGTTASRRATVVVLKINLDHRIDLRQGLIDEGIFSSIIETKLMNLDEVKTATPLAIAQVLKLVNHLLPPRRVIATMMG